MIGGGCAFMAPSLQLSSEEILSTNTQRTVSFSLFLATGRYTDFDATFSDIDIYALFIYFSYSLDWSKLAGWLLS